MGRKIPGTSGIILAKARNIEQINTIIEQDPFYKNKVAEYEVTEFVSSMTLPKYNSLKEQ